MARGLTRRQIGVTEEMIDAFGEVVFRMSHNYQVRRGDPIRELDWDAIAAQREGMGLADAQIADKIGLTREQVLFIRTVMERRRFRTGHYQRLLELGGGRRFRAERFTPHLDRFTFSEDALRLRAAMRFPPERVRQYVERGWWRDDTLSRWLAKHAADRPDAPAVRTAEQAVGYAELAERVERLAVGLARLGVGRGETVAVQLPNSFEFMLAYLAIARLGAVMTTLHMPYRAAEMKTLLAHSRATMFIGLSKAGDFAPAEAVLGLADGLPSLDRVVAVGEAPTGAESFAALAASEGELPEEDTGPVASDPFLLLYTSGTTQAPKGVPLNYHTMLSNARLGAPEHGIGPNDAVLSAAPFSHLFGLYAIHISLAVGACQVLLPAFAPDALARTVATLKPTALWAGPAHMQACRDAGLFEAHDWSSLNLMILSGSACPAELMTWLAQALPGCAVTQLWGMTETQAGTYTRPGDAPDLAATSAGRPSPGTELRVVGEAGEELGEGEEGELQVRGPLLFPGYLDNDDANLAAFAEGGWFRSGDLAVIRPGGNLTITGRLKDVINRGGVKYNPRDIEDILTRHPKVAQAAVVPYPDETLGERACCFAVAFGPEDPTLEELCAWLAEHGIAKTKLPERLEIVDAMPLTPTRKIVKAELAKRLREDYAA